MTQRLYQYLLLSFSLLAALTAPVTAQVVTGAAMVGYRQTLGTTPGGKFAAHLTESSIPGNILWPGDEPQFSFQLTNQGDAPIQGRFNVRVIAYGTRGAPGDVWTPHMFKVRDVQSLPINVDIGPHGYQDMAVSPAIPGRFGAYALVVDGGSAGKEFLTTCVRTFKTAPRQIEYPHFCLDNLPLPVLQRLGVHAIRWGIGYKPTTDPDFAQWYADRGRELKAYHNAGVTVLLMAGGGDFFGPTQPLGRPRPWLSDAGVMLDTKFDLAWLPAYDNDFQKFCFQFANDYGWPRGPITAFSLWNEPWEGISISGWGADMIRYRDIYTHMWNGVNQARHLGAEVLVGGTDSSSNAQDKLFPDNSNHFGPMFDFLSIHYQGLSSTANYKQWINRKGYGGRVKVWDTESWVANTDDRVAAIVAGDRAAGYDRAMGIFGGNICETQDYDKMLPGGKTSRVQTVNAWSVAASVGAATHFIGERPFKKLLFSNGLPWVMLFGGEHGNTDDGTAVVVGDLGEEFGSDNMPFRTARGTVEIAHRAALRAQLAGASSADRAKIQTEIDTPETLTGATMTLPASHEYALFDFYGNTVPARNGSITVPLDGRGFFLRGNGHLGSFEKLVEAIKNSRIQGIEPLAIVAHDLIRPVQEHPDLKLSLTNVMNHAVTGKLVVFLGGLKLGSPAQTITLGPNQQRDVLISVEGGAIAPSNSYPLSVRFSSRDAGNALLNETLHVDYIARRTIVVDGDLSDWNGILPQTIVATGPGTPTLTEQAWLPFKQYDSRVTSGLATAYLAYDSHYFYFAAKIADDTPDAGTLRFATRDENADFYPEKSSVVRIPHPSIAPFQNSETTTAHELTWPEGVRRYSYRRNPELPAGNFPGHDNIQIAFNVLPYSKKKYNLTTPGTMPGFVSTQDMDYEYALNKVAPQYGGGTEIWRLAFPGMPLKHFYPRQPRSPFDGPVNGGKLVIRRDGGTLVYECSIPWSEMPAVKARIDARQTVKFSYRVNDETSGPTMELSKGRSVAKRNGSFHVDWVEHWANELEFGCQH